jgi:D-aminoacyl-tRNA deacylase
MPVVFYSAEDPAGVNVAKLLKENHGFQMKGHADVEKKQFPVWVGGEIQLVELQTPLIAAELLKDFFKSDLFIFASKHRSESGKPCYTVHAPGNWGDKTDFGGNTRELQLTSAKAQNCLLNLLKNQGMDVFREATHHGPTSLKTPSLFVEVGSTEKEWNNWLLAEPVADAIVNACKTWLNETVKAAIGFGGTHYCNAFSELPFAFSHVASKHSLDFVNAAMVKQAVEKTIEPVEKAFIDWKGCNQAQRANVIAALEENGLNWERA